MIEEYLVEFGSIGVFCAYLIYDKQVLMKKLINALEKLTQRIERCPAK